MTVSLLSFFFSTMTSWFLLLTRPFHEKWTGDHSTGVHKTHRFPALRVGGIPIFLALVFDLIYLYARDNTVTSVLYFDLVIAGSIIFVAGIVEDITARISPMVRLVAAFASGAFFILISGVHVTNIDIPLIGLLFDNYWFSFVITCVAIAGIANAVNIIDGYNGLASGALAIMFAGLGLLAYRVGDVPLALVALSFIFVILGFFIFNFPLGRIFLGDGGAYFLGFALAVVTILLFERNAEVSPWTAVLVLAYPIVETAISVIRKTRREGSRPDQPDGLHLHMLVHRSFARPIARRFGNKIDSNPIAGVLMWAFPALAVVLAQIGLHHTFLSILFLFVFIGFYLAIYLRVALLKNSYNRFIRK